MGIVDGYSPTSHELNVSKLVSQVGAQLEREEVCFSSFSLLLLIALIMSHGGPHSKITKVAYGPIESFLNSLYFEPLDDLSL